MVKISFFFFFEENERVEISWNHSRKIPLPDEFAAGKSETQARRSCCVIIARLVFPKRNFRREYPHQLSPAIKI